MCLKYKKRNFMLPVKSVIPPNNSLLFPAIWNICRIFCDGKQRKSIRFGTLRCVFVDEGNKWRWVKLGLG